VSWWLELKMLPIHWRDWREGAGNSVDSSKRLWKTTKLLKERDSSHCGKEETTLIQEGVYEYERSFPRDSERSLNDWPILRVAVYFVACVFGARICW